MAAAPSDSFPDQMESVAEREALYRFLANDLVTLDGLLEGHVRRTHERLSARSVVRIVHDTTDFLFEGDREGLGVLKRGARGFFAHVALAVGLSFVVRGDANRVLHSKGPTVAEALSMHPARIFRTVSITARRPRAATRQHPARNERDASLVIRWGAITIRRASGVQSDIDELPIFAVHVFEPNPPAGEEAIDWMLFTSERVESLENATAIVDHYRARWVIEEYVKALKTGCAFEKRQLTTYVALQRALGLFIPAAWLLLAVRHLGRADNPAHATSLFDAERLLLLDAMLRERRYTFLKNPTGDPINLEARTDRDRSSEGDSNPIGRAAWVSRARRFLASREIARLALALLEGAELLGDLRGGSPHLLRVGEPREEGVARGADADLAQQLDEVGGVTHRSLRGRAERHRARRRAV